MLGFLKKILHRDDDFNLDIDLNNNEFSNQFSDNNVNTQPSANLENASSHQNNFYPPSQTRYNREEPSFLNPQAFMPYQPPSNPPIALQQEDNIRQQLEIIQSKIDMLNSKIDMLMQRLQMLEQYFYYRR